jgi:hypothetical protein
VLHLVTPKAIALALRLPVSATSALALVISECNQQFHRSIIYYRDKRGTITSAIRFPGILVRRWHKLEPFDPYIAKCGRKKFVKVSN